MLPPHFSQSQGSGQSMLECRGVVKPLPSTDNPDGWKVQIASGTMIPFVTDGKQKFWATQIFQGNETTPGSSSANGGDQAPELDLDSVVAAERGEAGQTTGVSPPPIPAPIAPLKGLPGDLDNHT